MIAGAKSLSTQASTMASENRTQYARRAERRRTSLLTQLHVWQAITAAHEASIDPAPLIRNILTLCFALWYF